MTLPMGTHRLAHSPQDPDSSAFWSEARALRARAWERVVREASGVSEERHPPAEV